MKHQTTFYYLLPTALFLIQYSFFHGGYFGYDEMWYSKIAASVIKGEFTHFHLYCFRYAMILPLALIYKIVGINDFSNFLFNIIQHWVVIYIILQFLQSYTARTKWLAILYYTCLPIITLYIEKPMPDIVVMTGFSMMVYGYYQVRFLNKENSKTALLWFVIGAIFAFWAKETFLIFYPIFLFLAGYDTFYQKSRIYFWKWTSLILTAFLAFYFLGNYLWFGDALKRVHTISAFSYVHDCSYDHQPLSVLFKRVYYELWFAFIRNAILLPVIFLPLLWKKSIPSAFLFLYASWLVSMLLANFMTISYSSYVPLCPDPRHFMFAFPIGACVFAIGIEFVRKNIYLLLFSIAASVMMLYISIVNQYEITWFLFIPLIAGLILMYLDKPNEAVVVICLGIMSMYITHAMYNDKTNYKDQKKLPQYILENAKEKSLVVTDAANVNISNFIGKFDTTMVNFVDYAAFDTISKSGYQKKYLIMNGMTMYLANQEWDKLPEFAKTAHEKLPKVYENKSGAVYLLDQ